MKIIEVTTNANCSKYTECGMILDNNSIICTDLIASFIAYEMMSTKNMNSEKILILFMFCWL